MERASRAPPIANNVQLRSCFSVPYRGIRHEHHAKMVVVSQNRNEATGRCCALRGRCRWRFAHDRCAINSAKMAAGPKWRRFCSSSSAVVPLVIVVTLLTFCVGCGAASNIPDVTNWVVRFGREIFEYSRSGSYFDEIKKGYGNAHRRVVKKDGHEMVREMTNDIETMVAGKINAVKRITETVEQVMMSHEYEPKLGVTFRYNNAKTLNQKGGPTIELVKNPHFYNIPVNTSNSSIHVPINVYNKAPDVVNAIKWSGHLNYIFESNYLLDPSLSWQYFGSSTGFLRQYPAIEWKSETKADTYDCRMRSWYIQAATSPKDMVIMIDNSGSMTGLRKEIAKHVALNILDTLSDDDHFNIFMFNNTIKCLVECYNESLVPASMENIREYKLKFKHTETKEIANFTLALITAFELLAKYNNSDTKEGSQCNQAIMLITDGASDKYENIFRRYNDPERRVRVFTYFIGQEMSDVHEVEAIACNNRGTISTIPQASHSTFRI